MRIHEVGRSLVSRLRARRTEIEQAALTRIYSVSGTEGSNPEYLDGLRTAVSAALDYGIEALERSEDRPAPIPTALLSQARLAARHGVKLDTVLRRYLAGHTLLCDFLIEESGRGASLDGDSLKRMLRTQGIVLDRLIAAVSEEYMTEVKGHPESTKRRRVEHVKRLLAGELLDPSGLGYDLEVHHLGLVASGTGAIEVVEGLARDLASRPLILELDEHTVWAWLGSLRSSGAEEIARQASENFAGGAALAMGEPAQGLVGWRLTHRQARAALPISLHGSNRLVRYADVALLASSLQDDLLTTSLRELYLVPLLVDRDGPMLIETLRAYFSASCNVSSAAASLSVSRQTVGSRLRTIEERLGRALDYRSIEMEVALRLHDLAASGSSMPGSCESDR